MPRCAGDPDGFLVSSAAALEETSCGRVYNARAELANGRELRRLGDVCRS